MTFLLPLPDITFDILNSYFCRWVLQSVHLGKSEYAARARKIVKKVMKMNPFDKALIPGWM